MRVGKNGYPCWVLSTKFCFQASILSLTAFSSLASSLAPSSRGKCSPFLVLSPSLSVISCKRCSWTGFKQSEGEARGTHSASIQSIHGKRRRPFVKRRERDLLSILPLFSPQSSLHPLSLTLKASTEEMGQEEEEKEKEKAKDRKQGRLRCCNRDAKMPRVVRERERERVRERE